MTKQQSALPQYWIFKDSHQNYFSQDEWQPDRSKEVPSPLKRWLLPSNSQVKPSDVVYFWREEDSSYFYGWGVITSEPVPLDTTESSPYQFGIEVSYHSFDSILVMRADLNDEAALKTLSELTQAQREIIELNDEQATALNRLLRARGVVPPADPISEEAT